MLDLANDTLTFRFPMVHPHAELRLNLQRTLRIPDDGKSYPLPPGLGNFPVRRVDDFAQRAPAHWRERGGVMVPMYASEALWIAFSSSVIGGPRYPFAVRVAAGKINAVSGEGWSDVMVPGDHLVTPPQPWLDGFAVGNGRIRQFVAAPLGMGLTVEQQLTGREEYGGLQIEVRPLKATEYLKLFERNRARHVGGGPMRSGHRFLRGMSLGVPGDVFCSSNSYGASTTKSLCADMGLGAGGTMDQQVYADSFGIEAWDSASSRVFLHLTNSLAWEAITGEKPPATPCSVEAYARAGMPWFTHYVEGAPVIEGGKNLQTVKSVKEQAAAKGVPFLPTNESVDVSSDKVVPLGHATVRDGNW